MAEVTIGPPSTTQLTLLIDEDEHFSAVPEDRKAVFGAMLVHEIGHLFGLIHRLDSGVDSPPGSVMYPFHQKGVLAPTAIDIQRVINIYGPPTTISF